MSSPYAFGIYFFTCKNMYRLIGSIISEELTKNLKLLYGSNMDKIDRRSKHLISNLDRVNHRIFLPHPPKLDSYSLLQKMFWGLSSTKSLYDSCRKIVFRPNFLMISSSQRKKINLHSTIHDICYILIILLFMCMRYSVITGACMYT